MTIQRNLAGLIPEAARRTIEELDLRLTKLQAMITAMAQAAANNNGGGLTAKQQSDVLALVAGRSSSVIGQEAVDPLVTGLAGGSVTSFSAGDLSPLFTTNEATPTTTPALAFAQIVQNANLVYAGPSAGSAANPTFRAPVAADLYLIATPLLQSTSFNLNSGTKQVLYTVPTGKSAIILWVVGRSPSTDLSAGASLFVQMGFNGAATDWTSGANLVINGLTSSTSFISLSQEFAAGSGVGPIGTSVQTLRGIVDTVFGAPATVVIDVFGYVF